MFDRNKFRAKVMEEGKTMKDVSGMLNINSATLYRKMSGESDFFRDEIQLLCEYLHIKNPTDIFFAEKVT